MLCANENECDECDDVKELCTNKNVTCHFTSEQQSQVNVLLYQFNDLFSDMPGKTDLTLGPEDFRLIVRTQRNLIV